MALTFYSKIPPFLVGSLLTEMLKSFALNKE